MGEREMTYTFKEVGDCSIHCRSNVVTCNAYKNSIEGLPHAPR